MFASPKRYQLWSFTFHLAKIPIFILLSGIYIFQLQAEIQPCLKTQVELPYSRAGTRQFGDGLSQWRKEHSWENVQTPLKRQTGCLARGIP